MGRDAQLHNFACVDNKNAEAGMALATLTSQSKAACHVVGYRLEASLVREGRFPESTAQQAMCQYAAMQDHQLSLMHL